MTTLNGSGDGRTSGDGSGDRDGAPETRAELDPPIPPPVPGSAPDAAPAATPAPVPAVPPTAQLRGGPGMPRMGAVGMPVEKSANFGLSMRRLLRMLRRARIGFLVVIA